MYLTNQSKVFERYFFFFKEASSAHQACIDLILNKVLLCTTAAFYLNTGTSQLQCCGKVNLFM